MNPDAEIFYPEYLKRNQARKIFSSSNTVVYEGNRDFSNCSVCKEVHNLDKHWFEFLERSVSDHELIMSSQKYNFEDSKIPVVSHLNIDFFKFMLTDYFDRNICQFLEFGFPIGCENCTEFSSEKIVQNHKGAVEFPDDLEKYLKKEIEKKAVLGPFHVNPFSHDIVISPLNSVPKKGSQERRIILDLSVKGGGAVNGYIDKDSYLGNEVHLKYPNVDALVELIKKHGRNCFIFKRDLSRAYRQIFIDLHDVHLVGYKWNDHLYFDRVLSMGLRSAAHICQRVTNAVAFMYRQMGFDIVNYLDDFAGVESVDRADKAYIELKRLLDSCGLEESSHKAVSPSTRMEFLGIICDTSKLLLQIPDDKLKDIQEILLFWTNKRSAKLRDIQSLVGKLNFMASCVRPGCIFMSRLLNWLRSAYDQTGYIVVPSYVQNDILWWVNFLPHYNGISMMMIEEWSIPDEVFSSDACLSGCGGWFGGKLFHQVFPEFIMESNLHINCLELLSIIVCLKLWAQCFRGKRIRILCDNITSVTVINTGKSRDTFLQCCLRELCYIAAIYEFEIRAVHLAGTDNRLPDYLSRWHTSDKFAALFYNAVSGSLEEFSAEEHLFKFSHKW
ncbi:Hypothetical predicted protein [Mytilus galloprovincialis]|uniref:Reverse transcriptase domain-containing protein n=1 Tax=Mytilus galloprovincialis TaxID=29158 RepID=A0A8B6D5J5_MYTGA|nr:Hypothetical predicted protein [Mytilus galloprovincialis]